MREEGAPEPEGGGALVGGPERALMGRVWDKTEVHGR
jgi:hypothetical protein